MNRLGVFAIAAAAAGLGAVSGAMAVDKKKGQKLGQQPYSAVGSGLLATGAAAIMWKPTTCPSCPPGGPQQTMPTISRGGFGAAVALASIIGGYAGATVVGKNPGARMAQQVYAPIGAALAGAGAAAIFWPDPAACPTCNLPPAPPPVPAPGTTPPAVIPVAPSDNGAR